MSNLNITKNFVPMTHENKKEQRKDKVKTALPIKATQSYLLNKETF